MPRSSALACAAALPRSRPLEEAAGARRRCPGEARQQGEVSGAFGGLRAHPERRAAAAAPASWASKKPCTVAAMAAAVGFGLSVMAASVAGKGTRNGTSEKWLWLMRLIPATGARPPAAVTAFLNMRI